MVVSVCIQRYGTVSCGFSCVGTYTRRSTVTGQLVPSKGLVTVVAPATGMVSHIKSVRGG